MLTLAAAVALPPPLSWMIGISYIAYDTWLLLHMVRASRAALLGVEPPSPSGSGPSAAVLIAARNEGSVLPMALDAVLLQVQPGDRVLVIDDGSTDGTVELLQDRYGVQSNGRSSMHPSLQLLRKPNSGKARSLNLALRLVQEELVITLDADTCMEPGALQALRAAFAREPALAAACGVLTPVCQPGFYSRAFQLYQTFEYLRGFLWRLSWMRDDTLVLISGAFAAFRRTRLEEVGGFDPTSLVEDYELMFRLHRKSLQTGEPLKARVVGEARATTDAPARPGIFLRQRTRWFAGFIETIIRNRDLVGSSAYGRLGTWHLRLKTIDLLLPIYGLLAFSALIAFAFSGKSIDRFILALLVFKLLFDLSCHFYAFRLYGRWQGKRIGGARALLATLTEPFGFQLLRQLGALLGWVAFLRGRIDWHPQRKVRVLHANALLPAAASVGCADKNGASYLYALRGRLRRDRQ